MVKLVAGLLMAVAIAVVPVSRAAAAPRYVNEAGYGMAAIGTNLFYIPAKMLYGVGGGLVGALGYGLTVGNLEAAHNIWSPSLGGTWVLSQEMIAGEKPILFSGESYEPQGRQLEAK
jgi:hypothetical protein